MSEVIEQLERKLAINCPEAFWLRPDWGSSSNLRDPGTVPFWCRKAAHLPPYPSQGGGGGGVSSAPVVYGSSRVSGNLVSYDQSRFADREVLRVREYLRRHHGIAPDDLTVQHDMRHDRLKAEWSVGDNRMGMMLPQGFQ